MRLGPPLVLLSLLATACAGSRPAPEDGAFASDERIDGETLAQLGSGGTGGNVLSGGDLLRGAGGSGGSAGSGGFGGTTSVFGGGTGAGGSGGTGGVGPTEAARTQETAVGTSSSQIGTGIGTSGSGETTTTTPPGSSSGPGTTTGTPGGPGSTSGSGTVPGSTGTGTTPPGGTTGGTGTGTSTGGGTTPGEQAMLLPPDDSASWVAPEIRTLTARLESGGPVPDRIFYVSTTPAAGCQQAWTFRFTLGAEKFADVAGFEKLRHAERCLGLVRKSAAAGERHEQVGVFLVRFSPALASDEGAREGLLAALGELAVGRATPIPRKAMPWGADSDSLIRRRAPAALRPVAR